MKNLRHLLLLSMLLSIVSLFALNGCEKAPFIETVAQTPYLALPTGMNSIISLNIERLRDREGFAQYTDQMIKETGTAGSLQEAIEALNLGFDPLNDIDLVIIGQRGTSNPDNPLATSVLIARGNFDDPQPKLQRFTEWLGEELLIAPPPFSETTHPGTNFKRFQTRAQSQYNESLIIEINIGFPTDELMVVAFQNPLFNETLNVIAGKGGGLATEEAWLAMIGRANTGAMFWGTGNISTANLQQIQGALPNGQALTLARQFYFDFDLMQEFRFNVGLVCETIDDSEKVSGTITTSVTQAKSFLPMFLPNAPNTIGLLDRLVILTELETTKLHLTLDEEQRRDLVNEWKELSESMGQNGGGMMPFGGMPGMGGQ